MEAQRKLQKLLSGFLSTMDFRAAGVYAAAENEWSIAARNRHASNAHGYGYGYARNATNISRHASHALSPRHGLSWGSGRTRAGTSEFHAAANVPASASIPSPRQLGICMDASIVCIVDSVTLTLTAE
jgi:hypothetical protein